MIIIELFFAVKLLRPFGDDTLVIFRGEKSRTPFKKFFRVDKNYSYS